jgi:hypothetical protein
MKIISTLKFAALAAVGFTLATQPALGQAPVISSFGQNGQLVCTNLQPSSTASVEWASSALGPWTNNWAGLESVTANSNGMIQVGVPMFYRVRGTPPPTSGNVTFTKWITSFPNQPGLIANMAGVVGGDVGDGTFAGKVLKMSTDGVTGVTEIVAYYRFNGPAHSFTALVQIMQTGGVTGSKAVIVGVVTDGWLKGHALEGEYTQIAINHDGGTGYQGTLAIKSVAPPPSAGQATFTKWITSFPNQPGLIATMAGVVGGDVGTGTFAGEVLKMSTDGVTGVTEIVAYYRLNGPTHSFAALVQIMQTGGVTGSNAVILGSVTDGWLKVHAVAGEYTQIAIDHDGGTGYQGTLDLK